jgi:arylsulfatase A-like enzyme
MYNPKAVPGPQRSSSRDEEARQHPFLAWMIANHAREHYTLAGNRLESDLDLDEVRALRAAYYGLISEVDHHVGRVLDHLRATGELDSTLVIFTSDHGEHLGDHYLFGKSGYFDQGFHIPLVVRDPSPEAFANRGRSVDAFTEAVDVMPTLLGALGLEVPRQCDGESLRPFFLGDAPGDWRTEAHWEYDFRDVRSRRAARDLGLAPDECSLAVIRGKRYKYVHFAGLPPLFFDLEADPHELRDLSRDSSKSSLQLEYAQRMLSWRMNHADRALANMHLGEGGVYEWRGPRHAGRESGEQGR